MCQTTLMRPKPELRAHMKLHLNLKQLQHAKLTYRDETVEDAETDNKLAPKRISLSYSK